jgi:hypothetical protein
MDKEPTLRERVARIVAGVKYWEDDRVPEQVADAILALLTDEAAVEREANKAALAIRAVAGDAEYWRIRGIVRAALHAVYGEPK